LAWLAYQLPVCGALELDTGTVPPAGATTVPGSWQKTVLTVSSTTRGGGGKYGGAVGEVSYHDSSRARGWRSWRREGTGYRCHQLQARVPTGGPPPGLNWPGAGSTFSSSQQFFQLQAAPWSTRPGTKAQVYRPPYADSERTVGGGSKTAFSDLAVRDLAVRSHRYTRIRTVFE
jgi:hypothetical protein